MERRGAKRDIFDIKQEVARDHGFQSWREMVEIRNITLLNSLTDKVVVLYHKKQKATAPDEERIREMFEQQTKNSEQLKRYDPLVQQLISIAFVAGATWFKKEYQ